MWILCDFITKMAAFIKSGHSLTFKSLAGALANETKLLY
jgi:hypothetical protein